MFLSNVFLLSYPLRSFSMHFYWVIPYVPVQCISIELSPTCLSNVFLLSYPLCSCLMYLYLDISFFSCSMYFYWVISYVLVRCNYIELSHICLCNVFLLSYPLYFCSMYFFWVRPLFSCSMYFYWVIPYVPNECISI